MSREVLGAAGPENEPTLPASGPTHASRLRDGAQEASGRVAVLDLDADPPRAGDSAAGEPDAGEASAITAGTPPGASAVVPASADSGNAPTSPQPPGLWRAWRHHPRRAVAGAALAGALVTALLTTAVLERRDEAQRYADVRLVADVVQTGEGSQGPESSIEVDLVVVNTGQDAVRVVGAGFAGTTSDRLEVLREVRVPEGGSARVPARADLACTGTAPSGLDLTVRTQDGRERTVTPGSFFGALDQGPPLQSLFMACDGTGGHGVDIWSTTARPDGTLSMRVRNPGEEPVTVSFRGPAGTQIVSDPPAPLTIPGRSGVSVLLSVEVERCTAAAQRAAAADDVMIVTDDLDFASLWGGSEVAGWFARSIALQCG